LLPASFSFTSRLRLAVRYGYRHRFRLAPFIQLDSAHAGHTGAATLECQGRRRRQVLYFHHYRYPERNGNTPGCRGGTLAIAPGEARLVLRPLNYPVVAAGPQSFTAPPEPRRTLTAKVLQHLTRPPPTLSHKAPAAGVLPSDRMAPQQRNRPLGPNGFDRHNAGAGRAPACAS
jgi:hypothetical protein